MRSRPRNHPRSVLTSTTSPLNNTIHIPISRSNGSAAHTAPGVGSNESIETSELGDIVGPFVVPRVSRSRAENGPVCVLASLYELGLSIGRRNFILVYVSLRPIQMIMQTNGPGSNLNFRVLDRPWSINASKVLMKSLMQETTLSRLSYREEDLIFLQA